MASYSAKIGGKTFSGETRAVLTERIVDYFADEDFEFRLATDVQEYILHDGGEEYPLEGAALAEFVANIEIDLEQAREDYENNDPTEHRTHPL